ncbi:DNA-binding transcriptional LysR family regulator [Tamaricihabitans halophyticus]|uniref:DNA-binding transcriptional LysR family regulator n=1 Tax=Tamaricihabitans halophyticus TaxID=1262583 RepID=A0A4R2R4F7_9PSEU|nr:LysR family transcriptional regulator [Tamaricihabitans halophyticus]TCP54255.1 DNA-binding transcriptional LysR family regulator [Tamaricihabitans halophyticus]
MTEQDSTSDDGKPAVSQVDRRQLEYFLAVVEHGSYTRAAESLFLAQSALSHGIRKLERTLGGRLFERVNRRMRLTELGTAALGPARNALHGLDAVTEATAEARGLARAQLNIATISTLSYDPTAGLIGQLRQRHPGISVRISAPPQPLTSAVADAVRVGMAEIGLSEMPAQDPKLTTLELPAQEMRVVLPPAARGRVGARVALETVLEYGIIVGPYWESSTFYRSLLTSCPDINRHITVRIAHRNAFVSMAMAGAGATFIGPAQAERARKRGAVVAELDPAVYRRIAVLHRTGHLSPAAARFLELCAELPTAEFG